VKVFQATVEVMRRWRGRRYDGGRGRVLTVDAISSAGDPVWHQATEQEQDTTKNNTPMIDRDKAFFFVLHPGDTELGEETEGREKEEDHAAPARTERAGRGQPTGVCEVVRVVTRRDAAKTISAPATMRKKHNLLHAKPTLSSGDARE